MLYTLYEHKFHAKNIDHLLYLQNLLRFLQRTVLLILVTQVSLSDNLVVDERQPRSDAPSCSDQLGGLEMSHLRSVR